MAAPKWFVKTCLYFAKLVEAQEQCVSLKDFVMLINQCESTNDFLCTMTVPSMKESAFCGQITVCMNLSTRTPYLEAINKVGNVLNSVKDTNLAKLQTYLDMATTHCRTEDNNV